MLLTKTCYYLENQVFGSVNNRYMSLIEMCFYSRLYGMYVLKPLHFQTTWFRHYCVLNMGLHYFQLNYDENAPCDDLTPIQLLYSGGVLNAFVWQHPAALEGDRWETVMKYFLLVKRHL